MNQRRTTRQRTNDAMRSAAARIDDQTGQTARRAAGALAVTVGVLRIPSLVIGVLPFPFIAAVLLMGAGGDSVGHVFTVLVAVAMAAVSALFFWRRQRMLTAVDDPEQLASELAIMSELAAKDNDSRTVLLQIAGDGGYRAFSRMRGLWTAGRGPWMRAIGELPRAKWFGPPRVGTTVTVSIAALWLIPVSVVVCLFTLIAVAAGSL